VNGSKKGNETEVAKALVPIRKLNTKIMPILNISASVGPKN
jgi:hypothetical protein